MEFFKKDNKPTKKLERTWTLAESFAHKQTPIVLDELENALLKDEVITWDRKIADQYIGQRLALAYSLGSIDKTENKTIKKVYL